jgi:hypothetical protein
MQTLCSRQTSPTHPSRIHIASSILLLMVLAITGCAPWVTYPPIEGAAHLGHSEIEPVPSIITESIRFANERFTKMEDEIVFNLPAGATAALYHDVANRLRNARPMTEDDDFAIHIAEVRVRATNAEVDVVYPRADGLYEMVTLTLRQRLLNHYRVLHSRLWRIHVEAPTANYVPPTPRPIRQPTPEEPAEQVPTVDDDDPWPERDDRAMVSPQSDTRSEEQPMTV